MTTGERIRNRRKEIGLRADDVAEALGVSRTTIFRYENGHIEKVPGDVLEPLAVILRTTPAYLMGWDEPSLPKDAIPFVLGKKVPIIGVVPAGSPALAYENIEGYDYADVAQPEDYFFLRVKGNSMEPKILDGDLVLVQRQPCADNGQIVVCLVNGDEATLKRYKQQGETIILMPDNITHEPYILTTKDFDDAYAKILGVVKEARRKL